MLQSRYSNLIVTIHKNNCLCFIEVQSKQVLARLKTKQKQEAKVSPRERAEKDKILRLIIQWTKRDFFF